MIQIVLMDSKKFVNTHQDFGNDKISQAMKYVKEAMKNPEHSIIEISKWENAERPSKMKRKESV